MGRKLFVHGPELDRGGYPDDCPFSSRRAGMVRQSLLSMGLLSDNDVAEVNPVAATPAELKVFHQAAYLQAVQDAQDGKLEAEGLQMGLGTPDCPIFKNMFEYLSLCCGATLSGARMILDGGVDLAFNPSGGFHHAGPAKASGFCFFNDVVLGCEALAQAGRRVLFLDIDVHHGDGVQTAFYQRRDVMTLSVHENGRSLFPGTGAVEELGEGEGRGYSVNLPLPVGTYDDAYLHVFREGVLPLICAFDPQVIVLEIGMDTLAGDPLAHLHLSNNVHAELLQDLRALGLPILATGGGGYHIENTVRGWALAWQTLIGEASDDSELLMGGVMLQNRDWAGGLRDRVLLSDAGVRDDVDREVETMLKQVKALVFPLHGL